jgi:exodeoxyribonuclease V alpha subunit
MPAHISVRLYWHDNAWNGHVCKRPGENGWCEAHDQIRWLKDTAAEKACSGCSLSTATPKPPCEASAQAFSRIPNSVRIYPPDWMGGVKPMDVELSAASAMFWPYEGMWDDAGKILPIDKRQAFAEAFRKEVTPGHSLAMFYVDERNPLLVDADGQSRSRVLVGISRVREVGKIQKWNEPIWTGEHQLVFGIPFKHGWPEDGVLLPVHRLLAAVPDVEKRAKYVVSLDRGLRKDFRYVSSHVTADRMVMALEAAISSLRAVQLDGALPDDFSREIAWLEQQLRQLWGERGPYPGMGAVVEALGGAVGGSLQKRWVPGCVEAGKDPGALLFTALEDEGAADASLAEFAEGLDDARAEWEYLDESEKNLGRLCARMALDAATVHRILRAEGRAKHGLPSPAEILANPYLLCERYLPPGDEETIAFHTVDHAVLPNEAMPRPPVDKIRPNDPRRLRVLLLMALMEASANGHTFLARDEAVEWVKAQTVGDRVCDVPPDRLRHPKIEAVLDEVIEQFSEDGREWLAARSGAADEAGIRRVVDELLGREALIEPPFAWHTAEARAAADAHRPSLALSAAQEAALTTCFTSPLSLLTGAAGTGKSSLLSPLLSEIREREGEVRVLALAPTGKAAARLRGLDVQAKTIHRALSENKWWDHELARFRDHGGTPIKAHTLLIDEMSMVDVTLLSRLFRAIDWSGVVRVVLVGDYHQLPPIGPGRPFYDLVARAARALPGEPYAGRLVELTDNYRVKEGSEAIRLAQYFAASRDDDDPGIWSRVAGSVERADSDLRVRYWSSPEELHSLLTAEIETLCVEQAGGEKYPFDALLGHSERFGTDFWQIIGPVRGEAHGTRQLNATIQDRWHAHWKEGAGKWKPVRFGEEHITRLDKVIQVQNERRDGWNGKSDKYQLFNGQMGLVRDEYPSAATKRPEYIRVGFDDYDGVKFSYKDGEVGGRLELAYAITVHKSQGSQFAHVLCVIPKHGGSFLSRELLYTALTRSQRRLTLFIEEDVGLLVERRKLTHSAVLRRNSRLTGFFPAIGQWRSDGLIHTTTKGERVRSKSEVIVADHLHEVRGDGVEYDYEEALYARSGDKRDLRLPDFTVRYRGRTWYWEHLGLIDDPTYRAKWIEHRRPWYEKNGYGDALIESYDGPGGTIDSSLITKLIRERILKTM